jgi:hypothetical protein
MRRTAARLYKKLSKPSFKSDQAVNVTRLVTHGLCGELPSATHPSWCFHLAMSNV